MSGKKRRKRRLYVGGAFAHPKFGNILIIDGAYEIGGRVSNHWTAHVIQKDGSLGREVGFYGQSLVELEVQKTVKVLGQRTG